MASLRLVRDSLLEHDRPAIFLRLADQYFEQMETMGDQFRLPKDYVSLQPLLEQYAGDLDGWLKFVKNVRDRLEPKTGPREEVQQFYRTLVIRKTQQDRRERLKAAIDMAVKMKKIPDTVEAKERYAKRCTQVWVQQKTKAIQALRNGSGGIKADEREEMLNEFWQDIRENIDRGLIPEP